MPEIPNTPATDRPGAKQELRRELRTARRRLSQADLDAASRSLARRTLALPEVEAARTVACYVSFGAEPPTDRLLDELLRTGRRVILPVLLPDLDLDWAAYDGRAGLLPDTHGVLTPSGARLGPGTVAGADVVVVPGLAAGADGTRLGRGGGSYDRALARVPSACPVVLLLHDGEVLDAVPVEHHDRRVDVAVTPSAVHRF